MRHLVAGADAEGDVRWTTIDDGVTYVAERTAGRWRFGVVEVLCRHDDGTFSMVERWAS